MNNKLQQAKNEIAKELNYKDWETCINDQPNYNVENIMDKVAERYHELMSEWISVDDRLPEFGDRILCIDDGVVQIANYENNPNISRNKYFFLDEQDEQSSFWIPTHWKPLPQPPKQ